VPRGFAGPLCRANALGPCEFDLQTKFRELDVKMSTGNVLLINFFWPRTYEMVLIIIK